MQPAPSAACRHPAAARMSASPPVHLEDLRIEDRGSKSVPAPLAPARLAPAEQIGSPSLTHSLADKPARFPRAPYAHGHGRYSVNTTNCSTRNLRLPNKIVRSTTPKPGARL